MTGVLLVVADDLVQEAFWQPGELACALAQGLGQPVVPCRNGEAGELVVAGIRRLVAQGVQRVVAIPLVFPPQADRYSGVEPALKWASRRWPFLTFHAAAPPSWQEWACLLKDAARDAQAARAAEPEATALLIAGPGGPDSLANADLARMAHLVSEAGLFARVDYAFLDTGRPRIPETLDLLARLGHRNVVLMPWLLAPDHSRLRDQAVQAAQERDIRIPPALPPPAHPGLLDILIAHHRAALEDDSLLAPSWNEIAAEIARNAGTFGHAPGQAASPEEDARLRELDRKINEMLPPQYQGRYAEVSPTSMGSAGVKFGPDGQVAWDEMWTSFCDLALAGGPAHRGTLLEAVSSAEALAQPEKYQAVVAEIERGIKLVTGLPVVQSKIAGWVGVRCDSEAMAVWLLRAIIVENVMIRREGEVLYLPAGPQFTLRREIKNVVTVVAKTCHYWTAHLAGRRRPTGPPKETKSRQALDPPADSRSNS
jgi:sirohydrochlorin cobaltochelatase